MTDHDARIAALHDKRAEIERYADQSAERWSKIRSTVEAEIKALAEAKLAEQRAAAPVEPTPHDNDTTPVILFRKALPLGVYTFAAVRAAREPRPWTVTQTAGGAMLGNLNWAQLLNFIEPQHWGMIRRLGAPTQLALVGTVVPDTVDALTDEHRGHTWIDNDGDRWEHRDGDWRWSDNEGTSWNGSRGLISPNRVNAPYTRVAR